MTNETRMRIEAYKNALPEMRERVAAVAILLVMSIAMMVSASFAWLTISRSPEVAEVSTTVAANGNLEIALATGKTTKAGAPDESQVGDSTITKGVVGANTTWGNLVNLSDASYGLEQLTLRPAQLNLSSLLVSPLYGAVYQGDGRIEKLNSSFAYSTWDSENNLFMVSSDLGVRAISSTTVEAVGFAEKVFKKKEIAVDANKSAGTAYINITLNKDWMDSLATVMGIYMTARMNSSQGDASLTNPEIDSEDVQNLTALFGAFVEVYDLQFEAMAQLANYQLFLLNNSAEGEKPYTPKTANDMKVESETSIKAELLQISGLKKAQDDYQKLELGYAELLDLCEEGGNIRWDDSGLNKIVNRLMDVGTCTVGGTGGTGGTPINNIGASNATQYLSGTQNATITNGVLFNFEHMNGDHCFVKELSISAKVKRAGITIPATVKVNIQTNAPTPSLFSIDLAHADTMNQGAKGVEIAEDTYGLAVDLWVRTNAANSYLTLEGNVLTQVDMVSAIGKDANGKEVELYTLTRTLEDTGEDGKPITSTQDIYQVVTKDENDEDIITWYDATTYTVVEVNEGDTINPKLEEVITVLGYEGENRIWENNKGWENNPGTLSLDATTQGSGSCYVYYADTPEDQARSLKLLEAMNVAFVDDKGSLLATAIMDTSLCYAENGRITVPLVLRSDSLKVETTSGTISAITPLVQNEPKRITAIVYLDGTLLSNQEVLADADIQGKLNLQFGSSITLNHAKDETLFGAIRSVSASVSESKFDYDISIGNNAPMTTRVTVTVDGDKPEKVTGFFIRAISATQGSRERVMEFTLQDDGTWISDYTFEMPGNYILRSVDLDGQTYDLDSCPMVTVTGFTVSSLVCSEAVDRHISVMTADSTKTVNLKLQFASDQEKTRPKTVQGRFIRNSDGSAVNINFTYHASGANMGYWTGQATFISSGEYTLEFLVLNGEYVELEGSMIQTATVYLGMKTEVYTSSPLNIKYVPAELKDNEKNLYMQVKILDNTGAEMTGLQNVHLYYKMDGSSVSGFDAPLTWNAGEGYYTCTFSSEIGVFRFSHVTVGSNTLTYATKSPVFFVNSPEPPSFEGYTPNPYVYDPDPETVMNVRLKYSSAASVVAVIRKIGTDNVYEVQGTLHIDDKTNNIQTWNFLIPVTSDKKQDGNWQMESIKVWNYYDENGNLIKAERDEDGLLIEGGQRDEPMVIPINGNMTKAVTTLTVKVNLPKDYVAHLGNSVTSGSEATLASATATFLDTHNVTVPNVIIEDFEHKPVGIKDENNNFISYVTNVKFVYDYGGESERCGGYTSTAVSAKTEVAKIELSSAEGGTEFTQGSSTATVQYAGVYTPNLQYTVNDVTYTKTAKEMGATAPTFTVWSKKPIVEITAISPTGTFGVDKTDNCKSDDTDCDGNVTSDKNTHVDNGATPSFSATTATVYFKCTRGSTIKGNHNYTRPSVTMTIDKMGVASQAELSFGSDKKVYNGTTQTGSFVWSANGKCTRNIGYYSSSSMGTDTKESAGTITAEYLTLLYDGKTYSFKIPTITINNPY